MISSALNSNINNNSKLQTTCIHKLETVFLQNEICEFKDNSYFFQGIRGNFEGMTNYSVNFQFKYFNWNFEFSLSYDQLEYYILRNENILKRCNLEDYTSDEEEMIGTFIKYLKKDMEELDIPFNK